MKASAGHKVANTSLHTITRPKVPHLRRVPAVGDKPRTSIQRIRVTKTFKRIYLLASFGLLILTTLLWALLGARLQNNNADQLTDSYLFESLHTFQHAQFPGQHTFLLKWPLFWLQNVLGTNVNSFEILTIMLVLVTVGGLAYLLRRIERRPVMLGTMYLALASVLLLVPTVPYPGALLPTNMAMLTTRNVEYVLYLGLLVLCIRAKRLRSWSLGLASVGFATLFASDRLFASLSVGGALIMLVVYGVAGRQILKHVALRWSAASIAGGAIMVGGLAAMKHTAVTGLVNQSNTSPFLLAHSLHDVALGAIYSVLGIFTNFGANPGHNVLTLREVPGAFRAELISASLPAYLVNITLLGIGVYAAFHVSRLSFTHVSTSKRSKKAPVEVAGTGLSLAVMLLTSSITGILAYALTSHYYVVDSRYLTITMITLFVCLAVYSRSRAWRSLVVMAGGMVLVLSCICGVYFAIHAYQTDRGALQRDQTRNMLVAQALQSHKSSVLLGNYWRVLPIRLDSKHPQVVLPFTNCTTPRTDLASTAWQLNLHTHSFAYLLTLDTKTTDFPACTLKQVTAAYGQPNATTVLVGTTDQPQEVLLFYDHGIGHFSPISQPTFAIGSANNTLSPVHVDKLLAVDCPGGQTVMQVVAHEDDDLLFMNPDLEHAIDAGDCIRTVYVTAGDAGSSKFYWLGREQGSEAAYAKLAGVPNVWLQQTVKLANHEFATIASPVRDSRLTLMFLHLPDGNVNGQGFSNSEDEGLAKLETGGITTIRSVDGQSTYSYDSLQQAIRTLINAYSPDVLHTQLPYNASQTYPDHSDHMAVGQLTTAAFQQYELNHPYAQMVYYTGYPVHDQPQNVDGTDLGRKEQAFFTYSRFDGSTCRTMSECAASGVYDVYLQRQYLVNYQP
jgi:LmbE family N-acetylglucosaminyl deacetylase